MKLILVRGLPGAGKSTYAKQLINGIRSLIKDGLRVQDAKEEFHHFEADSVHETESGYQYNPKITKYGHMKCLADTAVALSRGGKVFVSNTFTTFDEMYPYIKLSKELNIEMGIINCRTQFESIHDVPEEVMDKMRDRWEEVDYLRGDGISVQNKY